MTLPEGRHYSQSSSANKVTFATIRRAVTPLLCEFARLAGKKELRCVYVCCNNNNNFLDIKI